ncbi:MAG: 6-bladed beta-propeller [Bacteroidetes bacterium]|nr:6-bladed beta-propeller [Bacteroidota bacterium]
MKKLLFLFLSFLVVSIGKSQTGTTLRIDPKYARGGSASQLFDEIKYIPLESRKESTFGSVQRLQVSRHYFAFFDYSTKAVYVFEKNGKFKGRIGSLPLPGNVDALAMAMYGFVLNTVTETIFIVYDKGDKRHTKRLAVFDGSGKLLESRQLGEAFDRLGCSFAFQDGGRVIFSSGNYYEKNLSPDYLYVTRNFDTVIDSILPKQQNDPLNKSWHDQLDCQAVSGEGAIWYRLYDKTVVYTTAGGALAGYKFVLPAAMTLDSSFYGSESVLKTEQAVDIYLQKHQNYISYLTMLQKTRNILGFSFVRYNYTLPSDSYMYSLSTGTLYGNTRIVSDSLSYSLPLFNSSQIAGMDDGCIYLFIPAFSMFATADENKDQPWKTNPVLSAYFANAQNRKGNPVLVQLRLKNTL